MSLHTHKDRGHTGMQVNKGLIVTQNKHNKGKRSRQGTVELRAVPKKSNHQKGPTLPNQKHPYVNKTDMGGTRSLPRVFNRD